LNLKLPQLPFWSWALGGTLTIFGLSAAVSLPTYTTTRKEFCLTCHQQQREPSFWEQSTVHPKINCSECHATGHALVPSINIFPLEGGGEHAGFSAKFDQINPNCIRCHPRVFEIERASPKINPYNVSIPHRFHIQEVKASCTDCHYNIYHDPHDPSTFRPPKEACFECHAREKTSCSKCHPKGAIPLPVTSEVSHSECGKCHKGFEDAKIRIYDLPFPHHKHIARILNCGVCHGTGKEHGKILKTRMQCLSCHHQSPKSNCAQCHETQFKFIEGEALREVQPQPGAMASAVKCIECHGTIAQGHSLPEVKRSCGQCHDADYGKKVDQEQKEVMDRIKRLKLALEPLPLNPQWNLETLRKEVGSWLKTIEEDKSKGVHNFDYARKLISQAEDRVFTIENPIAKSVGEPIPSERDQRREDGNKAF